jgi:hypothetical protein
MGLEDNNAALNENELETSLLIHITAIQPLDLPTDLYSNCCGHVHLA